MSVKYLGGFGGFLVWIAVLVLIPPSYFLNLPGDSTFVGMMALLFGLVAIGCAWAK